MTTRQFLTPRDHHDCDGALRPRPGNVHPERSGVLGSVWARRHRSGPVKVVSRTARDAVWAIDSGARI
jgi:hypothetical protein